MTDDATIKSELAELGERIECQNYFNEIIESPDDWLQAWKRKLGSVSPKKVYEIMSEGCQNLHIIIDVGGNPSFNYGEKNHADIVALYAEEPLTAVSGFEICRLSVKQQGADTGKLLLRNLLNLKEDLYPNIKRVDVYACVIGAYAWLKFGFVPERQALPFLQKHLTMLHEAVRGQLSDEDNAQLDRLIASDDPKSLWKIVDMTSAVTISHLKNDSNLRRRRRESVELGKYLLLGDDYGWKGHFDFTDPEAISRMKNYTSQIGKKRGLHFENNKGRVEPPFVR